MITLGRTPPPVHDVVATAQPVTPAPVPIPAQEKASEAGSVAPMYSKRAAAEKKLRSLASALPDLKSAAIKKLRPDAAISSPDARKALELLSDKAIAQTLTARPAFVRPSEIRNKNKSSINLNDPALPRENGKVPLSRVLKPHARYLWVMTPPETEGGRPVIHIGFEYENPHPEHAHSALPWKNDAGKFGHPTLLDPGTERRAVLAGELIFRNGAWTINNDSGRWHAGNPKKLKELGVHKADLMAAAAQCIHEQTDLSIGQGQQYSGNGIAFVQQKRGKIGLREFDPSVEKP